MDTTVGLAQYEKVLAHVRAEIAEQRLRPGDRLVGERVLASQLEVSRQSVRQGLRLAHEAGLIVKVPSRGTFVAQPRIRQDLGRMQTFDLTVRGVNLAPTYEAVRVTHGIADAPEAASLAIDEASPVTTVEAVGTGDGLPLAHYRSVLPGEVWRRLPPQADWSHAATYQLIAAALGVTTLEVRQELSADVLPSEIATMLRTETGVPAFRSSSVFSAAGTPVEWRTAWYPASRYIFTVARTIILSP